MVLHVYAHGRISVYKLQMFQVFLSPCSLSLNIKLLWRCRMQMDVIMSML